MLDCGDHAVREFAEVIVGADPASPQPTTPSASMRTSTLSAVVSTPLERLIGRVSGRLTAMASMR